MLRLEMKSIIFTNATKESRVASVSKENEQTRSRSSIVTTQIQQLTEFYPAKPEHQEAEAIIEDLSPSPLQIFGFGVGQLGEQDASFYEAH
ncbi:peptide methionine sulfoxide reductase A5-like [Senna tora]|uniref:peptide-methionine (S)-S-oxide reductase n=1 Tax=Senna tora TaxID=362788 RepID=A0A835CJV9_9FABA|nr:peptide methionine sulfoxide reductase A5-like [Senna tora]